jgi:hypothetical protein
MKQALHANCAICPLADILNTQVSSMGPLDPKAIVVLDTPSRSDAAVGTLMSGENGLVIRTLLKDNGLHPRDDVYYTSAAMSWGGVSKAPTIYAATVAPRACSGAGITSKTGYGFSGGG